MKKVLALVVVQVSVVRSPELTRAGDAESVQVGAAGGGRIVVVLTTAEHVIEPPTPVAIPV